MSVQDVSTAVRSSIGAFLPTTGLVSATTC